MKKNKLEKFGLHLANRVSAFVGTWTFVFLYTLSMVVWIVLHLMGILHIDSSDFIKWNLWLSYFAGTQASLVLMSSNMQAKKDRKKADQHFELDTETLEESKKNSEKLKQLAQDVHMIENVLSDFFEEQDKNEGKVKK